MEIETYIEAVASHDVMAAAVERMALVALTHARVESGRAVLEDPGALEARAGIRFGDVWRGLKAAEKLGYASGVRFDEAATRLEWALALPE